MSRARFDRWYEDTPGGKYGRKLGLGRYQVIEWIDMWDATGEEDQDRYCVDLNEVDLGVLSPKNIEDAKKCCGWDKTWFKPTDTADRKGRALVECCFDYGFKGPLGGWSGNNLKKLMTQARKYAAELDAEPDRYEEALNRPVNKIGSTAREFMAGDINSAMARGIAEGRPESKLMAKMYGVKEDDMALVEGRLISDDPLAYQMGYITGLQGGELDQPGTDRSELASEYIRGWQYGVDVKAGKATAPTWCKTSGGSK